MLGAMNLDLSNFDAAIIDLDGTMVDTLGDFVAALNHMLDDLALSRVDASTIATMVGKGSEHLIHSVLRHVRANARADADVRANARADADVRSVPESDDALYAQAWDRYQHHYLAVNGLHSAVYPGVAQGLAALRERGLRLACLTNKPTAFALPLLAAKGLDGFFEQVFGGDAFERKKPDPLPLVKTCEALGSRPARTLMVGDSSNDARAARAAGCPVVLVSYGYNHGEPVRGVDADGVVDSLAELGAPA